MLLQVTSQPWKLATDPELDLFIPVAARLGFAMGHLVGTVLPALIGLYNLWDKLSCFWQASSEEYLAI